MEFGEMKRNTSNWSNFCMLLCRAGLTASAGLSCYLESSERQKREEKVASRATGNWKRNLTSSKSG